MDRTRVSASLTPQNFLHLLCKWGSGALIFSQERQNYISGEMKNKQERYCLSRFYDCF